MSSEGIVYLIQPSELVGTERYKLGCSGKSSTQRLNAYKKGTRVLCVNLVKKPYFVEKKLKESFLQEFDIVVGNEYFITNDERKMYMKFHEIVGRYFDTEEFSFECDEPSTTNSQVSSQISLTQTTVESDSDSDFYVASDDRSSDDGSSNSSDSSGSVSRIVKRYFDSDSSSDDSSNSSSNECYCKITYKSQDVEERERLLTMLSEVVKTYSKYVVIDHEKCIGVVIFNSSKFEQLRNNFVTKVRNYKKKNNIVLSGKFNYLNVTRNIETMYKKVKGRVVQKKNMSGF